MNELNNKGNNLNIVFPAKGEVIITGIGGGGVLTVGTLLAEAAVNHYQNVTWFPSYAISKRGGYCECTVVYSKEKIASPLLTQSIGIIVAEASQFKDFEDRVRSGGTIVVENSGLQTKPARKDIRIIEVPGIQKAIELTGNSQGAGLVLLGAYLEATGMFPPEQVIAQIKKNYATKEKIQKSNLSCFEAGRKIARDMIQSQYK